MLIGLPISDETAAGASGCLAHRKKKHREKRNYVFKQGYWLVCNFRGSAYADRKYAREDKDHQAGVWTYFGRNRRRYLHLGRWQSRSPHHDLWRDHRFPAHARSERKDRRRGAGLRLSREVRGADCAFRRHYWPLRESYLACH